MNGMWKIIMIYQLKAELYGVEIVTYRVWCVVCGGVGGLWYTDSTPEFRTCIVAVCVCFVGQSGEWQQTSTSPLTRQKPKSESVLTRRRYIASSISTS
jgi:hypothetical protein